MPNATQLTPQQQQQQAAAQNMNARNAVTSNSVFMTQPLQSLTINPAQQNPIVIQPRPVGLITSFLVTISATIVNNDNTNALILTDFGLSNLLSNITFTDLNNNQRHNTSGWHLSLLNSLKHRRPYASGYGVESDTMGGYGETYPIVASPAMIAAGATATVRAVYEIPISYAQDDLRGAIYNNVINASCQLSLQINQTPFTAAGVDSTFAVYKGTNNAVISSVTINCYQNYYDQLPRDSKGNIILPNIDLSTVYELKVTNVNGMSQNNEYGFQYPNFRDVLSTMAIYNHDTSADSGRTVGTDINYWSLQSANFTNIWKKYPLDLSFDTRQIINCDLPKGAYYASSRRRPISSIQYGNMELVINPALTTNNSQLYIGLEDFNKPNTIVNAGSIQS